MKWAARVAFVFFTSLMTACWRTPHRALGWGEVLLYQVIPAIVVMIIIVLYKLIAHLSKIQSMLQELNRKVDLISKKRDE